MSTDLELFVKKQTRYTCRRMEQPGVEILHYYNMPGIGVNHRITLFAKIRRRVNGAEDLTPLHLI